MKQIIILFTIIFILGILSCSEDFLKPEPLSIYSPENVFTEKSGFEALLVTLRMDMREEHTGQKNFLAHQFMASEIGAPWLQLDFRQLTPTTDQYQKFVDQINTIFRMVKDANTIISRIDNTEWQNEQDRNEILAEAFWYRSYWYYRLVGNYGDLPFLNQEVDDAKIDYKSHSRWTILKKLEEDMEWAVEWLPENAEMGIPTRGAGNHLLTKIYLANLEFDKAVSAATKVIEGPYALMKSRFGVDKNEVQKNVIWDLHRPMNKNSVENTETILAFVDRFDVPDKARSPGTYTMRVYNCAWFSKDNGKDSEGKRGFIDNGALYDSLGRGNPDCPLSIYHSYGIWEESGFTYKNTPDLRRSDINWYEIEELKYNNPSSVDYGKPLNTDYMRHPDQAWARFYPMPIYKTYMPNHPDQGGRPFGSNGDWYIYRLAETYLLRAEAHFWKGDLGLAANDINQVRERANASLISAADVSIDYIFDERARELFAEEPRQNELNRVSYILAKLGRDGYSLENIHEKNWFYDRITSLNSFYLRADELIFFGWSPFIAPYHFKWPIDDKIINANTLGRINQNKGYTGAEANEPPLETIE